MPFHDRLKGYGVWRESWRPFQSGIPAMIAWLLDQIRQKTVVPDYVVCGIGQSLVNTWFSLSFSSRGGTGLSFDGHVS